MRAFALLAALLTFALSVSVDTQQRFHTRVEAVRVDVSVMRNGKPISGLVAADFDVRDRGVRQVVEVLAVNDVPLHLDLVLDTSFSTRGHALQDLKRAATAAAESLRHQDTVALISFSHTIRPPVSGNVSDVKAAIDALEPAGGTALADAVFCTVGMRPPEESRRLAIVFTDGFDTASWLGPMAAIESARRSDIVFSAVISGGSGIADEISRVTARPIVPAVRRKWFLSEPDLFREGFMPVLTDETGGETISVPRNGNLREAFLDLLAEFRSRYTLAYSPENVAAGGWHPIDVKVKGAVVRARRGYVR